jgi:iron complex transport system substrate-binding protein
MRIKVKPPLSKILSMWFRVLVVVFASVSMPISMSHADEARRGRLVSANLCADQLLLALSDPGDIAALSPFARDRTLSFLHERALSFPTTRGSAEELIDLKPRLVLVGSFDSRHARAMLEAKKIPFLLLDPWRDLEQGRAQIRQVATQLGQRERGEDLLSQIDRSIARLAAFAMRSTSRRSALVLHRRGYVLHAGVIVELAGIAGLRNAAEGMGITESATVPLERIVVTPPDYLIVTQPPAPPSDQGEAFLAHPALARLFPHAKRLVVPDNLSICAGPSTPALIDALAGELEAKVK